MTTYIILFFIWIGKPDNRAFSTNDSIEAHAQTLCTSMGGHLTKWHSVLRKYNFEWKGVANEQRFFPGDDYVCIREDK